MLFLSMFFYFKYRWLNKEYLCYIKLWIIFLLFDGDRDFVGDLVLVCRGFLVI